MDDSLSPLVEDSQAHDSEESADRLSQLHDWLIHDILSLLPMRDVVHTTLLSRRWRDLWITVPCLDFRSDGAFDAANSFPNFVNKALSLWKGAKIQKFHVSFEFGQSGAKGSDLDMWLCVAVNHGVEELSVNLQGHDGPAYFLYREYLLPQYLYTCQSIKTLSLVSCGLKIDGKVHWDRLKSLSIDGVSLSEHAMSQVLLGAPRLEVLKLRLLEGFEDLSIESSSLRSLSIDKYSESLEFINYYDIKDTRLRIRAPNVHTLVIAGVAYNEWWVRDASSLTNATLDFCVPDFEWEFLNYGFEEATRKWNLIGSKLVGEILGQVSGKSGHRVEQVALSDLCTELLGEMKNEKKDLLAPLSNAKFLELEVYAIDQILDALEIFPKLTTLDLIHISCLGPLKTGKHIYFFKIICQITEPYALMSDAECSSESEADGPKPYLSHLRTIKITWPADRIADDDESIFPIIETFLWHASKLDKLVLQIATKYMHVPPESLVLVAQKLLSMPRSSPLAEVIFCEC